MASAYSHPKFLSRLCFLLPSGISEVSGVNQVLDFAVSQYQNLIRLSSVPTYTTLLARTLLFSNGVSTFAASQQKCFQPRDSRVKLKIKSFKVPEHLF
ncbi:uncharacterized protein LOC141670771 isoform X2 [Apium graveolens]|uniref:uncharacterized protein LOC141670771 isoform X2 n=1 Tax=Apium graveolens TaxID=4045 RepID=UPI003D7A362A